MPFRIVGVESSNLFRSAVLAPHLRMWIFMVECIAAGVPDFLDRCLHPSCISGMMNL